MRTLKRYAAHLEETQILANAPKAAKPRVKTGYPSGRERRWLLNTLANISQVLAREVSVQVRQLLTEQSVFTDNAESHLLEEKKNLSVSFAAVALEWLQEYRSTVNADTYKHAQARLINDVLPWLGNRSIAEISAPDVLAVLKRIDARGARNTAHRVRGTIGQVFRYGVRHGVCFENPARELVDAIPAATAKHFASLIVPSEVGRLLRTFDGFTGTYPVECALRLAPLFFVRPGELRKAQWSDFDLDRAEWRYTVSKTNTDHLVPLATQAVAILRKLYRVTGGGRYVFPGLNNPERPMSHATLNAALRRLGYDTRTQITGHGFRAMARTILHEELEQKPEVIEHQLAHTVPGTLGRAYNRTRFIKERKAMMQFWADYLDQLKGHEAARRDHISEAA